MSEIMSEIFYQNVHCHSFSSMKLNIQFLLNKKLRELHNKNYAYYVYLFGDGDSSAKALREQHCQRDDAKVPKS